MLDDENVSQIVRPILREMYPLALYGETRRPAAFFIVQDSEIVVRQADGMTRINRASWKQEKSTRQPGVPFDEYVGPPPLIVYWGPLGADIKHLLPLAYIADTHGNEGTMPSIGWNSLRDMTMSKYMHASAQAFYLRRYSRRVATIWQEATGRRPAVFATTAVSYKRPPPPRSHCANCGSCAGAGEMVLTQ